MKNKAHFGKRNLLENHLIFFFGWGVGDDLKCFLRCETMLMDWLRGFISLTREFYLLQKKKKKKKNSVKPYPMKTTILTILFF